MVDNGFMSFQRVKMSPQDTKLNTVKLHFTSKITYCKTCLMRPLRKRRPKIGYQDQLSLNAGQTNCRMVGSILQYFRPSLSYHLSLRPFLSIFERPLKTGLAVTENPILAASSCTHMRICVQIGTPPRAVSTGTDTSG